MWVRDRLIILRCVHACQNSLSRIAGKHSLMQFHHRIITETANRSGIAALAAGEIVPEGQQTVPGLRASPPARMAQASCGRMQEDFRAGM